MVLAFLEPPNTVLSRARGADRIAEPFEALEALEATETFDIFDCFDCRDITETDIPVAAEEPRIELGPLTPPGPLPVLHLVLPERTEITFIAVR
jgi:hypothetical protein